MLLSVLASDGDRDRANARPESMAYLEGETVRLTRLAAGFLHDPRDVEDAVQDTLEAAIRSWSIVREESSRRAWLNTICVRRCLRARRWRLRHSTGPLLEDVATPAHASDVEWDRAFVHLTVTQRVVIVLHYHHGFTLDECAALMGRHPGTARKHLSRGLARLRTELNSA